MNAVGFIFARGGSKGLPGKNIRPLLDKPLIAWSIEQAKAVTRLRRVIVSTDSPEIAEIALKYGAEVPYMRPAELATDNSSEWLSWRHGLEFLMETEGTLPDAMVSIPPTAPLRESQDIDNCLDLYLRGGADIVITATEAHRNPFFNMICKRADGKVELVMPLEERISRRQDAPEVFDMTTVAYVVDPKFVLNHTSHFEGSVSAVYVPKERAIDIDTLLDFEIAEILMRKKRLTS